jgi:hypothetical protein
MMMTKLTCLAVATAMGTLLIGGAPAFAQNSTTFIDFTGEVGYGTNPFLRIDGEGSGYGRVSAYASHSRTSERSLLGLSAYVENSTYFTDYDSKQIFDLGARAEHQTSETVRIFGNVGFSGDIAGQLSNRFVTVPVAPADPDQPTLPPDIIVDPDLASFTRRQYRLRGQVGASIRAGERGTVSVSGGAHRILYTDDFLDDYTTLSGNVAYDHTLSERSSVGGSVYAWRANYDGGNDHTTVINPQLTYRTQLSENINASAGIGVSFARRERDGSDKSSVNLSLNGSICRSGESEQLCGRVSRYANSSGAGSLVTTTSAGISWFKRLDEKQTVQLAASVIRYAGEEDVEFDSDTMHYRISGDYSRKIGRRLSFGVNASVRSLRLEGPNPDTDLSGSVYLRYRVGDIG